MLSTKLVLFLCFVGSVLAQFESICNYDCVATDVYGPYCGGAVCVYGETDPSQHEALCSKECTDAILGKPMRDCVLANNPRIRNLGAETRNMVTFIRVFCETWDIEHDIPPHPPIPAPVADMEDPPIDPPELDVLSIEDIIPVPAPTAVETPPSAPVPPPMATDDVDMDIDTVTNMVMDVEMEPPAAFMSGVSVEREPDEDSNGDLMDETDLV